MLWSSFLDLSAVVFDHCNRLFHDTGCLRSQKIVIRSQEYHLTSTLSRIFRLEEHYQQDAIQKVFRLPASGLLEDEQGCLPSFGPPREPDWIDLELKRYSSAIGAFSLACWTPICSHLAILPSSRQTSREFSTIFLDDSKSDCWYTLLMVEKLSDWMIFCVPLLWCRTSLHGANYSWGRLSLPRLKVTLHRLRWGPHVHRTLYYPVRWEMDFLSLAVGIASLIGLTAHASHVPTDKVKHGNETT